MKPFRCGFCSDKGRVLFDGVAFCRWHLILLYLGIHMHDRV